MIFRRGQHDGRGSLYEFLEMRGSGEVSLSARQRQIELARVHDVDRNAVLAEFVGDQGRRHRGVVARTSAAVDDHDAKAGG